ncbi:MAG: alkylation response protein AidB-like acyl-CoA dehydrogenase [Paraglaciecola psychrophila]|jgi:alkylation response protein AidB-like acyl-CoA dehydrogenase
MEFGLSQEQRQLQDMSNKFLAEQVDLDAVRIVAAGEGDDKAIWQGLSDLGIAGLMIPEACGGVGLGALDAVVIAECLGYHVTPTPFIASAVMAPVALIAANRDQLLTQIASGEQRVGIAFGEALGARNKAGVRVSGNHNKPILSGSCLFVLDTDADHYLIADANKHIYLVAADAPGLTRNNLTTVDKTRSTCELKLDNVGAELISEDPAIFHKALNVGRVVQAADTLGAAQYMLDQSVSYAMEREQFNRVIASFQAVKHMCAEMVSILEPCRAMVWYAGHALDELPEEATLQACQTKSQLSEVGQFVAKTATEVHGGMGFTDLVGLHYWFKRIGANRQLLGSPELVRVEAARAQGFID